MYVILIVAIVLIAGVGLVLPAVDPQGRSVVTRAAAAVVVDSRIRNQTLSWPARVFRWVVLAAALAGIVLIVTNSGAIVDWLTDLSLFKGSR